MSPTNITEIPPNGTVVWPVAFLQIPSIKIQDNNVNTVTCLENKDYVKFLWVLIDKHLTWKQHVDSIASKISKIVGLIARLWHHVPLM